MGWLDGLLRPKHRQRVTITEIAESLAWSVDQSVAKLLEDLESHGFAQEHPQRFNSVTFLTECLLFEAFLMDLISSGEFGPHSEAIREKLDDYVFQIAQNVVGFDPRHRYQFKKLQLDRFVEYGEALKAGAGDRAWGEKLSLLAAQRILPGTESFALLAYLNIHVANFFKHFSGMGSWADIVEGPR